MDRQPRQRGVFSEVLSPEETQMLKDAANRGPTEHSIQQKFKVQKLARAKGLKKQQGSQIIEAVSEPQFSIEAGFYSKKREGVADIDPKVFEPFEPIPGRAPRKVVIDRKKKLYASLQITDLLIQENIDYIQENDS